MKPGVNPPDIMRNRLHIFRPILLAFALIAQSLMPSAVALAGHAGYDVSAFMCAPLSHAGPAAGPSQDAQAHFKSLLSEISAAQSPDTDALDWPQCESCLNHSTVAVMPSPLRVLSPAQYQTAVPRRPDSRICRPSLARGPPLGGRAPPTFL